MTNDIDITLLGDEELHQILNGLNYQTQHKFLKRVVRDTAQKTMVRPLRDASPRRTGGLQKSMGVVSGRSKRNAVAFAGPRMGGQHKGYIANIIEFNKGELRYPTKRNPNRPKTPYGVRVHSGRMNTLKKGYIAATIKQNLKAAEDHIAKSIRTIIEREIRKYNK